MHELLKNGMIIGFQIKIKLLKHIICGGIDYGMYFYHGQ